MAGHGVRKLGAITGAFMVVFLFIETFLPVLDLYIAMVPAGMGGFIKFYAWGFVDGTTAVNMLSLPAASAPIPWITTIFFFAAAMMTIAASTPESISANSKRMFAASTTFCTAHLLVYIFMLLSSPMAYSFFLLAGPGFYILMLFDVSNVISWIKVQ
ncbi:MAG: hypothetical protein GYA24_08785 [Candidatus Lokiarchaeota archaeon]|nr:hypothetical protein [Candidatus Lokiarchaeota archaeon]